MICVCVIDIYMYLEFLQLHYFHKFLNTFLNLKNFYIFTYLYQNVLANQLILFKMLNIFNVKIQHRVYSYLLIKKKKEKKKKKTFI